MGCHAVSETVLRQKLLYRASYRGTAEMDFLLGGFARQRLGELDAGGLAGFCALLDMPDPVLEALVWRKTRLDMTDRAQADLADILQQVQDFHGL